MGTQNTAWEWLRLTWTGRAARRTYFDLDKRAGSLLDKLSETADPDERMRLMSKLATAEHEMASASTAGWGRDWNADDGMDMAQSMRWSACLYRLLADVEQAVAYPTLGRRQYASSWLGVPADDLLALMAKTTDLAERMAHLDALYDAVVGKVGGQAAEVIACLAYPGRKR